MSTGTRIVAGLAAVAVAITLFVTLFDDSDDAKNSCQPSATPGSTVAQGVPSGSLSKPMRSGTYQVPPGSGYRTPQRPDHKGVDLAGPEGAPIYAMADGVVAAAGPASGFGNWIVIDHSGLGSAKLSTVYGHMNDGGLRVKAGDKVTAGQYIADEGHAGEASGPHLHFEVWAGGRLTGGHDVDPNPWIDRGVDPGTPSTDSGGPSSTAPAPVAAAPSTLAPTFGLPTVSPAPSPNAGIPSNSAPIPGSDAGSEMQPLPAEVGSEMQPLPAEVGSEEHWQVDTIRIARAVHQRFPQITTIGGWRPSDPYPDHPSGRAADLMIPGWDTDTGKTIGDQVRDYVLSHHDEFHVVYVIWRQTYYPTDGTTAPNVMEDRGGPTANHYDHVHVTTEGHGFPTPGQTYGAAPESGATPAPTAPKNCTKPGSGIGDAPGVGGDLAGGSVPPEFQRWIEMSAKQCRELTPSLLAAQIQQESGFRKGQVSPAGALGYAQFMPGTWDTWGYRVDDNGNKVGPAGSGDPNSIGDAVMAAGAYDCALAEQLRPDIESGKVTGAPADLMLAAYNAGVGAVQSAGGIPPYAETQTYVSSIKQRAQTLTGTT